MMVTMKNKFRKFINDEQIYEEKFIKLNNQNKKLEKKIINLEKNIEDLNKNVVKYLNNVNYNPINNDCCPFCGSKQFNIEKEYSINYLMERWKQQYHFVPFSPCYVDKILERRVCSSCGLNYYNYFIPDTEEFYSILSGLHKIYSENKWDYDIAIDIIKEYRPQNLLDIG